MNKKILIAVDGSAPSMRAVAYVGDMLRGDDGLDITLYHVREIPPYYDEDIYGDMTKASNKKIDVKILQPAAQILEEKGLKEKAVKKLIGITDSAYPDIAHSIVCEAEEGGYGTIVLGRRGFSRIKELVFGSVSSKVVHQLKDRMVWLSD